MRLHQFSCLTTGSRCALRGTSPPPDIKLMKARRDGVYICDRMHSVLTHRAYGPPALTDVVAPARVVRVEAQYVPAVLIDRRGRPGAADNAHAVEPAIPAMAVARSGKEHRTTVRTGKLSAVDTILSSPLI